MSFLERRDCVAVIGSGHGIRVQWRGCCGGGHRVR